MRCKPAWMQLPLEAFSALSHTLRSLPPCSVHRLEWALKREKAGTSSTPVFSGSSQSSGCPPEKGSHCTPAGAPYWSTAPGRGLLSGWYSSPSTHVLLGARGDVPCTQAGGSGGVCGPDKDLRGRAQQGAGGSRSREREHVIPGGVVWLELLWAQGDALMHTHAVTHPQPSTLSS